MAGIRGIRLDLKYNPVHGNVRATVAGYPHTVAVLPMNSREAVLTSTGMLAYRDHRNSVKAILVTNHKEIMAAVREADNDALWQEGARHAAALQTLKESAIKEVTRAAIKDATITNVQTGQLRVGKVDASVITSDKITARGALPDLGNEIIDGMRHEIRIEYESQIRKMAKRIAEDRKTMVAHEKTIRDLIAKVNKSVTRQGILDSQPEIDRTCTDHGGLFTGPASFADDNPFVNRSRGKT